MTSTHLLVAGIFGVSAIACFASVLRVSRLQQRDVRLSLYALLITVGTWSLFQAIQMTTHSETIAVVLFTGGLIIGFATPFAWLYFASAYTGRKLHRQRSYSLFAVILYSAMVVIKLTNPIHGQYFTAEMATEPYYHLIVYQGPIYWLSFLFAYGLTAIGMLFLFQMFARSSQSTWQLTGLVGLTGLTVIPKVVSGLYPSLIPELSYEPIGVAIFAIGALYLIEDTFLSLEAPVRDQLFEQSDKGIISITPDRHIYEYNQQAASFFPEIGTDIETVDDLLDWLSVEQLSEDAQIVEVERDNERTHYLLTTQPLALDSHQIGQTLIIQDITESYERKRELKLFRKAVENAGQAILITNRDGQIQYVNSAFEQQTGYSEDEVLDCTPNILNSGKQSTSYYANFWETIIAGDRWEATLTNQRKSGELYTVKQEVSPLTDEDGEVTHFVGIESDVTKQRRRKQQLTVLNRILRHNLRNGINVIQGYTTILDEQVSDSELQSFVDAVDSRATELARTSKKAGRLQSLVSQEPPSETSYDVCETLRTIQSEFEDTDPGVSICIMCNNELSVKADDRLELVLNELLKNAILHNDQEDLEIEVTVRASTVDRENQWVDIIVEDNGSGIPKSERKILETGTETPLQHGTGLGLWLVHWTVDLFGGEVDIKTRDSGTRVKLTLLGASNSVRQVVNEC